MAASEERAGLPPISARDSTLAADRHARLWSFRLLIFMRALAAIELVKGMTHWALIIGAGGTADPLGNTSAGWLIASAFFAVADPVAAVGLWLVSGWGVVIWLLAAIGQLVVALLAPEQAARWLFVAATVSAMTAYVFLSVKARQETR